MTAALSFRIFHQPPFPFTLNRSFTLYGLDFGRDFSPLARRLFLAFWAAQKRYTGGTSCYISCVFLF